MRAAHQYSSRVDSRNQLGFAAALKPLRLVLVLLRRSFHRSRFDSSPINSKTNEIEFISKVLLVSIRRKMAERFHFILKAFLLLVSLFFRFSEVLCFQMKSASI